MFDLINGTPVHPLVVHAIVVLLPLAVLGTFAIAAVPRWRATYGPLVVAAAAIATVLIPVATASGEELEKRVGDPEYHAEMGEMLIWFALPLLVLVTALWWLARRASRAERDDDTLADSPHGARLLSTVAALAVVAALATSFQVYRVGDSGAQAVWDDATTSQSGGS